MNKLIIFFLLYCVIPFADIEASIQWVPLSKLSPTQFTIGHYAMLDKRDKMIRKYDKGLKGKDKLRKYLLKKTAPAYLAQNDRYYIVDRHHTSRALYEADLPIKEFPIEVIEDLSHLSMAEFFEYLDQINGLYLYERGQGPLEAFYLPQYIWELSNDPYRSLSWMIREEGAYENVEVNFLEFLWANYLRKHIHLKDSSVYELKKNLKRAIEMAQDSAASHLPGYRSKNLSPAKEITP